MSDTRSRRQRLLDVLAWTGIWVVSIGTIFGLVMFFLGITYLAPPLHGWPTPTPSP